MQSKTKLNLCAMLGFVYGIAQNWFCKENINNLKIILRLLKKI
jgi:hypothetical protein